MGYDWKHTSLNPVLAKRLRNLNQDLPVAAKNNLSLIAEMIRVAKTYYNSRYQWDESTSKYVPVFRFNWSGGTALDSTYQPGTMYLDCSTFVGLILRGLTVQDSPYGQYLPADVQTFVNGDDIIQDDTTDIGVGDENFDEYPRPVPANETMYPWVMDLDNMYEAIEADAPDDKRRVRTASQLAQYLVEHGRVIEVTPDLSNIQPGDLVFWAQKSNGEYVSENRYEHINNVAICYARESNPSDISVSNIIDCTIDYINYAGVKQYLDEEYGAENAVYKFEVDAQTDDWLMYKRGPKVDGHWTWTYLDVVGNAYDHWMLNSLIATSTEQQGDAYAPYFEIVRYEWDSKYPYKHILIMANDSPECITAPVLELCDTANIAMVCRPDLGAVAYGEYARQFADLGITHIDNLYRPGLYYVNDGLLQGLPEGTDSYYAVIRVEVTQQHSMITSVTQTVWHSSVGKQFVRSQTCFNGKFSPTRWSVWHQTIYTDSIQTEIEDAVADAMASYKKFVFVNQPIGSDTTTLVTLQGSNIFPAIASNIIVGDAIVGSDGYIAVVTQVQLPNIITIPTGEGILQISQTVSSVNGKTGAVVLSANDVGALPSETDTDVSGGGTFSPVNMSDGLETYDGETWRWSGQSAEASGWWRTNKIAVMPGYTYRFINFPKNAYLYPSSGGGSGSESNTMGSGNDFTYTIPEGFYYIGPYAQGTAKTGLQMYRITPTPEEAEALSTALMSPPFSLALENLRRDSVVEVLSPLKGKKIVNFGDSIFGNVSAPEDVSTFLSLYTGATAYNCAFGGTMMTTHWNANYALFSFHALVDAVVSGDWSAQDAAIADSEWTKPEAFAPHLATLKALDFSEVDIITIAYGTNDWNSGRAIDNTQNLKDLMTYCGAFRYSIEKLLTAYPHLRVFACTPIFRTQLDENTHEPIQYSDTWQNANGKTLPDFCAALRNVSAEYGIKCIDNYYELGFNKLNRTLYYRENDGTHPSVEGRKRIARNVASGITSVGVGWPVGSSADLSGYATQTWVTQQGYLTLSSLPIYNGGVS